MKSAGYLGIQKVLWLKPGEGIATSGVIPKDEEFFQDHFPGFPVLPGVLALEMLRQSVEWYYEQVMPEVQRSFRIKKMRQVKFQDYLKPGDSWESRLELQSELQNVTTWKAVLRHHERIAVQATIVLEEIHAGQKLVV